MLLANLSDFDRLGLPLAALAGLSEPKRIAQLAAASSVAKGYLRQRYQLPILWDLLAYAGYSGASGNGPAVDAKDAGAIELLLDVTALSSGASLTVTLEHSDTGVGAWTAVGSFAARATAGQERKSFTDL